MKRCVFLLTAMAILISAQAWAQNTFTIGIMQAKKNEAAKYKPMIEFFKSKGLDVKLKGYSNYSDAARKFAAGDVDGMFAGSGVAGTMIIKEIAIPILRPVSEQGWSTYWAVVIAPKNSPKFNGDADYFKNKKIMCASLASSGEFFVRSVLGSKRELMGASSHGTAIKGVAKGTADVAVVKNRVWDDMKKNYPQLEKVGQDGGENPNGTLIVSKKANTSIVAKIRSALLNIADDVSPEANAVKKSMGIITYVQTDRHDFEHTLLLLEKAGVTKDFDFKY